MSTSHHPFAQAADLISSSQKDALYCDALEKSINAIARRLTGVRQTQRLRQEMKTLAMLFYFSCTTVLGNRTLGEEYCEILPVENNTRRFPALRRRLGHVLVLSGLPYLNICLRRITQHSEARGEMGLQSRSTSPPTPALLVVEHAFAWVQSLTSLTPWYALYLAIFYLRGRYYHFSKQLFQIRYVYRKRSSAREEHGTYEILGLLLLLQITGQGLLRLKSFRREKDARQEGSDAVNMKPANLQSQSSFAAGPAEGFLEDGKPRCDLGDSTQLAWIQGSNSRKCTLCLEPLKDPSAMTCGHVFCWSCIAEWIQEKPACPLCRQGAEIQHVLPMRS